MVIREVEPGEIEMLPALCILLQDCVDDGASVGFLAPLSHADASDYWRGISRHPGWDEYRRRSWWLLPFIL